MFILAFGDMLTRLTILPSLSSIPKIIMLMLPLMGVFAVPIASSLAIFTVIGQSYYDNEVLMFYFLPSIRRNIIQAIGIFSLCIIPLYAFLVFDFAPKSYCEGKEFLVTVAKEHLSQLEAGRFHYPTANFIVFFKKKQENFDKSSKTRFEKLLLMYQDDDKQRYVMTAREGVLDGDILYLYNGAVQNQNSASNYFATFQKTTISIHKLLRQSSKADKVKELKAQHMKFLTWSDLREAKDKSKNAFIEYHARITRILWPFLFAFLAFAILGIWGKINCGNLVFGIVGTSVLFLFSYLHVSLAKVFWINDFIGLLCMYGFISLICLGVFLFYRRKWHRG